MLRLYSSPTYRGDGPSAGNGEQAFDALPNRIERSSFRGRLRAPRRGLFFCGEGLWKQKSRRCKQRTGLLMLKDEACSLGSMRRTLETSPPVPSLRKRLKRLDSILTRGPKNVKAESGLQADAA
jgi:hypothetical protein